MSAYPKKRGIIYSECNLNFLMWGIQKVRAIYYFLYSTKGMQEHTYCHFAT
jgi:hypothetical protein